MPTYTRHPRVEAMGLTALASSSDEELSVYAAITDDLQAMARRRYNAAQGAVRAARGVQDMRAAAEDVRQAEEQLTAFGIARVPVDLELSLRRAHVAELRAILDRKPVMELDGVELLEASAAAEELMSFQR